MKTVPNADQSGTIPSRASKNPVLGVYRHHCGEIASVHQPKGRKSHLRYLICDNCGTDQCSGKDYQEKIRANTFATIELLEQAELKTDIQIEEKTVDLTVNEPVETVVVELLETNENAVDSDIEPFEKMAVDLVESKPVETVVVEPTQTNKIKVSNQEKPQAEQVTYQQRVNDPRKPARVGFAALLGGLLGGVAALVL